MKRVHEAEIYQIRGMEAASETGNEGREVHPQAYHRVAAIYSGLP